MEERKLKGLKAQDQDFDYVIVADDEITYNGDLYDCQYNGFGLSHAEIGDYSWGEFDFDCDLKDAIKKHFGIEGNLEGLCITEDEINIHTYDADEEEELSELLEEKEDKIREFANKWAEKHESLVKGNYIEYYNGSNYDTIVLWSDIDDCDTQREYELLDEDNEEAIQVLEEYASSKFIEEDFYGIRYRSQKYEFYMTKGESWGIFTATKIRAKNNRF